MRVLNKYIFLVFAIALFACKEDVVTKQVYDHVIYEVDTNKLYLSSADKVKQKTPTQYISIMYSDLFNKSISSKELSELSEASLAMGDKTMVNELTLSQYLTDSNIDKPSDGEMRNDVEKFVEETYVRFFQRLPTPYERIYMRQLIDNDPNISVIDIYTAFILSNEYYYY